MSGRLNIAFVWHMHQPMYKDPFTGEYTMPWVLLHGTKDYLDMAAILEEFPEVHQTFNYVPCLVEQIGDYASGTALDRYRTVTEKPAAELTTEEKTFIIGNFFQANWDHMVRPLPRYMELLVKRGVAGTPDEARTVLRYFTTQDYLDLQVLFNLSWIDPAIRRSDEFLTHLVNKEKGFTEEEKLKLVAKQTEIMGRIVPKHVELQRRGIIEVTASPYYHPILPLLCDSFAAREAMPWATLPAARFTHPEDAAAQLEKAVEAHRKAFGSPPRGLWPSEGSVSMDILPLVGETGIEWFATDEEILSHTLKRPIRRDHSGNCYDTFLYRPYAIDSGKGELTVIFRDHVLSDLIGFDYAKLGAETAASDLVSRLTRIHGNLGSPEDHLVSIVLDGENAWETYHNDGYDFLSALYSKLSGHPLLKCVTVSEFLDSNPSKERLDWIYPGSWINHNFKIWIGHPEDNAAWDYISEARGELARYEESVRGTPDEEAAAGDIAEAWEVLYAAEGSDWFWWYGDDHSTISDEHFDHLFRLYIKRVYTLIGQDPPLSLDVPIITEAKGIKPTTRPTAFIDPVIDGEVSNYFEWLAAGTITRQFFGSAMHREVQGDGLIEAVAYGFSRDTLFLRFDYNRIIEPPAGGHSWSFTITFLEPNQVKVEGRVAGAAASATAFVRGEGEEGWKEAEAAIEIASEMTVEMGIPLGLIGAGLESRIRAAFNIDGGAYGVERWPMKGYLILDIPAEDFEQQDWIV